MTSASEGKRCHYEVLGLKMECTPDEIRSAYKKLALQRHPDKLVQSGLSQSEATAAFQELVSAYEVLSDPKERAWYDSHRSQILFSDPTSSSNPNSNFPDLFSYFSNTVYSGYGDVGKGFYKVYADVFDKVYANEITFAKILGLGLGSVREAPVMGNLDSPYAQVTAFYSYWIGFSTVMDFCWVDQYDVMAGPNRKSRRLMEEENKKLRKKAKREYNDTVRGLAEYVKKRDKRVIDMQVKKGLEMEKKREEERERKREMERIKLEKAQAYEEPEWARVEDEDIVEDEGFGMEEEGKELYCVVCRKKFKSDKQWKNHEQSKKHKDKVAEFRDAYGEEASDEEDKDEVDQSKEQDEAEMDGHDSLNATDGEQVTELEEQFQNCVEVTHEENVQDMHSDNDKNQVREESTANLADEERIILESMLTGRRNRRKAASSLSVDNQLNGITEEKQAMEYNNKKSSRRNHNKKEKESKPTLDILRRDADINGNADDTRETTLGNCQADQTSSFSACSETKTNGSCEKPSEDNKTMPKKPVHKKGAASKDAPTVSKSQSKGKKSKGTKASGNACDACGEEFESKNKLHRHLGETGHGTLKHR
ncbi:unnamed protein product [Rhodiola kirilowii]